MNDDLNNLDLFLDSDKGDADLLGELDALKGLLSDPPPAPAGEDDIPVLSEVVTPTDEKKPATAAPKPAATSTMPPPRTPLPTAARTAVSPSPPAAPQSPLQEKELEVMVDRLIDKEMPRIRVELKRVLLAELRLRGVLK